MSKNLASGLNKILSAGIIGFGLSGCADQNNHTSYGPAFFGTVAKVAGANLSDQRAAVNSSVIGDALYLKSTNDNRIDAARGSGKKSLAGAVLSGIAPDKPRLQPGEVDTPYGIASVFSCNYYKDYNNNGYVDYPEECIGIKNKFHEGELIHIFINLKRNNPLEEVHYALYDSRGKILEEWSRNNTYSGAAVYNQTDAEAAENRRQTEARGLTMEGDANKLAPGSYKSVWTYKGNLITTFDFEVEND